MPEHGFYLDRIFQYKNRIKDSVLIRENTGHRKPVFWHILRSELKNLRFKNKT